MCNLFTITLQIHHIYTWQNKVKIFKHNQTPSYMKLCRFHCRLKPVIHSDTCICPSFFGYILCSEILFLNCQFCNEWTSVLFGTASASSLFSFTFLEAYATLLCQHQSQIAASPFIRKCLLGKQIFELFVEEIMEMFSSTVGFFQALSGPLGPECVQQ